MFLKIQCFFQKSKQKYLQFLLKIVLKSEHKITSIPDRGRKGGMEEMRRKWRNEWRGGDKEKKSAVKGKKQSLVSSKNIVYVRGDTDVVAQ